MALRVLMVFLLVTVLCAPLWAEWPFIDDADERAETYAVVVNNAIAESQKAVEANDPAKARFPLIGVSDLCVPGGGNDPKVAEAVVTAYKAACAKAWAVGEVPDEKTFDKTVKEYAPKFQDAYFNALYLAATAESESSKSVFERFAKGASTHPAAVAMAVEFACKCILPEDLQKYRFQGKNSGEASNILRKYADIYGGPWAIARACKITVVPNSLETAETEISQIDLNDDDAQAMAFRAQMVENDRLKWVRLFDPDNAKCKELQAKVDAIKQKARELRAAQIKQNRMPPDSYPLDDKAELKAAMAKVFQLQPGAKIVKVVIPSNYWVEKPFVWVGMNNADAGWYKLIDGAVLCKYADGTFHVHPVTYGKRWIGNDNYGDLEVRGWADDYEILPQYAK
jgi:hypothetical protein